MAAAADDRFANSPFETSTETEKAFATGFARQIGNIRLLILSIGAVVFFTLLLVTGNTMASAVRERVPELGVLKTVGFTDAAVLALVLAESVLLALVGGGLGLGLAKLFTLGGDPTGGMLPVFYLGGPRIALGLAPGGGGRPARRRDPGPDRDAAAHRGRHAEGVIVAIPISYNLRSAIARWPSALVSVLGIAGTVGVFVAMLAMARGFQATLISSGSSQNAMILRGGADSEMVSAITLDEVRVDRRRARGGARSAAARRWSAPEVVVVAAFQLASSGTDANVQVRGVSPLGLEVRPTVRVAEGRFFRPGLAELVVGRNAAAIYRGLAARRRRRLRRPDVAGGRASSTPAAAPSTPSCGATPRCSTRSSTAPRTSSSR